MLMIYNDREKKKIRNFDVFRTVFGWIKCSRWRKKCKNLIKRARNQVLIQKLRRESIIRQSRADIAQLLLNGDHDAALLRVEQLHNDQCVLSAYDQIENFCGCVYTNLRGIARQSNLCNEVNEAVSSLVFAASRCGELSELHRIRTLLKQHFGNEFERVNVELQPGNFVNSQIMFNLGNNSVPDDVKLQLTSNIARECTLCLEPQTNEQNFEQQCRQDCFSEKNCEERKKDEPSDSRIEVTREICRKDQMGASIINDMLWRIGSRISNSRNLVTSQCDSHGDSSNRSLSKGSAPIEEMSIVYLDGVEVRSSICNSYSERGIVASSFGDKEIEENEESKPRLSYVHPKLPDYDELVATFTEYKKEYMKSNSNNITLRKWMRW